MLKLPPPIWALIYVLVALVISWQLGWPELPGLPLPKLGIALALLPWALPVWAAVMFRRAGTEINPLSPTNRALVVDGPYRYTRNPMYLGLVLVTCGIATGIGAWPMFLAPIAVFATANWVHIPFEETKMRRQFGVRGLHGAGSALALSSIRMRDVARHSHFAACEGAMRE